MPVLLHREESKPAQRVNRERVVQCSQLDRSDVTLTSERIRMILKVASGRVQNHVLSSTETTISAGVPRVRALGHQARPLDRPNHPDPWSTRDQQQWVADCLQKLTSDHEHTNLVHCERTVQVRGQAVPARRPSPRLQSTESELVNRHPESANPRHRKRQPPQRQKTPAQEPPSPLPAGLLYQFCPHADHITYVLAASKPSLTSQM